MYYKLLILGFIIIGIILIVIFRKKKEEKKLSVPAIVSLTEDFPNTISYISHRTPKYEIGTSHTQGRRKSMEDESSVVEFDNGNIYIGLFDGHGGKEIAEKVSYFMPKLIETHSDGKRTIFSVMKHAFKEMQEMIEKNMFEIANKMGCTALIIYINEKGYGCVANLGDSRAIVGNKDDINVLTIDHKPDNPKETENIIKNGGFVDKSTGVSRVNGQLAVSRAFGDIYLDPYLSHEPDIYTFDMNKYDTLVMGCDGVWDVLDNNVVMNIARNYSNAKVSSEKIRDYAFQKGSNDNISVIVLKNIRCKSNGV